MQKKKIDFKFIVKSSQKYKWLKKPNFELSNTDDIKKLEIKINEINKKKKITFILSTSDQFVIMANELNKRFNIKCEDSNLLKTFKNKFKCSKIMKKFNILNRKSFVMKNNKDKIPKITFPCIIKPNLGTGSINVYKINNLNNLKAKIKFFFKKKIEFVVEEYIDGQETLQGETIDDKTQDLFLTIPDLDADSLQIIFDDNTLKEIPLNQNP